MMRTAPRIVLNTAAGAAATASGHLANSVTFRRPSSKSANAIAGASPRNTADQSEWEFVRSESSSWSVESFGPVPSAEEAEEATRYLVESLTGSGDTPVSTQVHHQWPEADASLAKAEAALMMVPMIATERQRPAILQEAFDLHVTVSPSSNAFRDMVNWLEKDPVEAKDVAMSLATDEAVWAAVSSNAKVRAILAKSTAHLTLVDDAAQVNVVDNTQQVQKTLSMMDLIILVAAKAGELVDSLASKLASVFGFATPSEDGQHGGEPSGSGNREGLGLEGRSRLATMVFMTILVVLAVAIKRCRFM